MILTDVFETNPEYFYAVQASEAVLGKPSLKAYRDPENIFDHGAYVSQVIGALLTNPSDGSFKNFKYSSQYKTFISIDNDEVFKPEITGSDYKTIVNIKSMLFLFSQMDLPIPESIKTFFTTLDPHLTVLAWLKDLSQKNQDYQLFYTRFAFQRTRCIYQNLLLQSEVPSLTTCLQKTVEVDLQLHGDSFYPQILLSKDLLNKLIEKLQMIEKILLTNSSVSAQALFEDISPILGKYYRKLRSEFTNPEEASAALWGEKKNNVDYSYISSVLDDEELNNLYISKTEFSENLFPEKFFKEYRDFLISQESAIDRFIKRQNQRKSRNMLKLSAALKELRLLIQEGFTHSQSRRNIVGFCHYLQKMTESSHLVQEITFLLTNLPHEELKWLFTLEKYFSRPDSLVPKDSSLSVVGAFMKQRTFLLTESENKYLFDSQGDIRKNSSLTGRSSVTFFPVKNPRFYLKQYPEWPGYELASTLFMRLLGIQHLPYQDLLIINNSPVLLTQRVHGSPVLRVWDHPEAFKTLDPVHTTLLIISAMLINPEDGKEDNFILSPDKKYLIPIDNDHCFLPSTFQKRGSFWNAWTTHPALQTKTLLFCLKEMSMSIPLEVKQHIISLNFDSLLTQWMAELDEIENNLINLVPQNERNKFLGQGTVMRIPFYKQFIHNIYWKAHKIQDILKTALQPTPFDLLKAVEPFAARCYQDSFKQGKTLESRFKAATDSLYNKNTTDGSRVSILNTRAMMEIIDISEKDLQDDIMFQKMRPFGALEFLNQLIQERSQKSAMEQEMLCEFDEKKQKTSWINLFENPPTEAALKAFFANPKEGLVLKRSKLIKSSKLRELFAQTPDKGMGIRFLSLPESPSLSDKGIRILTEGCPNLEYLNVSGCVKLKEISTADGEWALLSRLEAKDCFKLEKMVSYSPLKILQIGTEQKIEIFVAKSILDLFTIEKRERLFWFSFKNKKDFKIKYRSQYLYSSDDSTKQAWHAHEWNEIKDIFQEYHIIMGGSLISSEGLETLVSRMRMKLTDKIKNLQDFVVLKLIHLKELNLSSNEINDEALEILTKGNWALLETLELEKNKITAEGVKVLAKRSNWPQLKYLSLSRNKINDEGLKAVTQGNWPLLEGLILIETNVTEKALAILLLYSNWPQFEYLSLPYSSDLFERQLAYRFIKKDLSQAEQLDFRNYAIPFDHLQTKFKKYQCPILKHVNVSDSDISLEGISVLTLADCPLLEELHIENIKITSKGIQLIANQAKWQKLKHLNVSQNEIFDEGLSVLLVAEWPLLESLNLNNTKLSLKGVEIIVREQKYLRLKSLNISNNEISDKGLSALAIDEWPLLEDLNVKNTKITQEGIEILVTLVKLPNLKKLDISENIIFDEGLSKLASGDWPLLQNLVFYQTKVTEKGHKILLENFEWPHLTLPRTKEIFRDQGKKT